MTVTTTMKEQKWNDQHFFAWDGVTPRFPAQELCFCGKPKTGTFVKPNYPTHFPETEPNIIKLKMATPLEEKVSDMANPLLQIAEGKRNIDEWNDRLMDLITVVEEIVYEERKQVRKEIIRELLRRKEEIDDAWTKYGGGRTYGEFVSDFLGEI